MSFKNKLNKQESLIKKNNNNNNNKSIKRKSNSQSKYQQTPDIITQINSNRTNSNFYNQSLNNYYSNQSTSNKINSFTPTNRTNNIQTSNKLLPNKKKEFENKKTLVLDLDETLVHSSFIPFEKSDIILKVDFENVLYNIHVLIRPEAENFITEMSKYFEIVIFTASLSKYASPLLDIIDKEKNCSFRLFRDHCTFVNGIFIKDLKRLNRNLKDVIIVDNSPFAYIFDVNNGLPIKSWFNDKKDKELKKIQSLLEFLSKVDDVREWIPKFVDENEIQFDKAKKIIEKFNDNYNNEIMNRNKNKIRIKTMERKKNNIEIVKNNVNDDNNDFNDDDNNYNTEIKNSNLNLDNNENDNNNKTLRYNNNNINLLRNYSKKNSVNNSKNHSKIFNNNNNNEKNNLLMNNNNNNNKNILKIKSNKKKEKNNQFRLTNTKLNNNYLVQLSIQPKTTRNGLIQPNNIHLFGAHINNKLKNKINNNNNINPISLKENEKNNNKYKNLLENKSKEKPPLIHLYGIKYNNNNNNNKKNYKKPLHLKLSSSLSNYNGLIPIQINNSKPLSNLIIGKNNNNTFEISRSKSAGQFLLFNYLVKPKTPKSEFKGNYKFSDRKMTNTSNNFYNNNNENNFNVKEFNNFIINNNFSRTTKNQEKGFYNFKKKI